MTWILLIGLVGWLAITTAAVVSRQHHLDGAADLVALSAAARQQRGGDPCAVAAEIATANRVAVTECRVEGSDVEVTVETQMSLPFGVDGGLRSTARAGP